MNQERTDPWPLKVKEIRSRLDDAILRLGSVEHMLRENRMWSEDREIIQKVVQELERMSRELCIPADCPGG